MHNAAALEARLFGCKWLAWDPPYHLYHFTPQVLTAALEKKGFRVVKTRFFSLEYSPFTLLQTILNAFSRGKNLLFRFIQATTPEARQGFRLSLVVLHGLLACLLALPSLITANVLGWLKMGNDLTVYARKA
mgnify:CR=1 FL=1